MPAAGEIGRPDLRETQLLTNPFELLPNLPSGSEHKFVALGPVWGLAGVGQFGDDGKRLDSVCCPSLRDDSPGYSIAACKVLILWSNGDAHVNAGL